MQIQVIAIGKIKESYLRDGITEYRKRLHNYCTIELKEHTEYRVEHIHSYEEIEEAVRSEGTILLKSVPSSSFLIALDPKGRELTSDSFASLIRTWEIEGPYSISFLIGGPHGLSEEVRNKAGMMISLSKMTFPHQMARMILFEQIYRAFTIIRGIPYHR